MGDPSKRYVNIVSDLDVDRDAYLRLHDAHKPASIDYVMLFTPRSGSTWLTSILSGHLGFPEEYLNPNFVRSVSNAMHTKDPRELLLMLRRVRKTRNGIFGIQVRSVDVELFGQDVFFEVFGSARFFNVWRRNVVAQAVSLYRATETQAFHSYAKGERKLVPSDIDEGKVLYWMRHIIAIERANDRILTSRRLPHVDLVYEDVTGKFHAAFAAVAGHIGVDFDVSALNGPANETQKLADDWNAEVERLVRMKHAGAILEAEMTRPQQVPVSHDAPKAVA